MALAPGRPPIGDCATTPFVPVMRADACAAKPMRERIKVGKLIEIRARVVGYGVHAGILGPAWSATEGRSPSSAAERRVATGVRRIDDVLCLTATNGSRPMEKCA